MDGRAWLQVINVLLYSSTLYLLIVLVRRGALSVAAMIAPASFFVHAIVFYLVVFLRDINHWAVVMTTWSAALRLHGGIIALAIVVALVRETKQFNRIIRNE